MACQLSELVRREGARIARAGGCPNLFVNTHPKEVVTPELLKSLAELREIALDAARDLFHRFDLRGRTDAAYRETH